MNKVKIIVIRESLLESYAKDFGTLALFLALVSIGIALESAALQFVGAFVGTVIMLTWASHNGAKLTIKEAKRLLEDMERGS